MTLQNLFDDNPGVTPDENIVSCAFFDSDGKMITSDQIHNVVLDSTLRGLSSPDAVVQSFNSASKAVSQKNVVGSNQSKNEIRQSTVFGPTPQMLNREDSIAYPYPVEILQDLLEMEETHFRCCKVKATDSVNRGYQLKNSVPIKLDSSFVDDADDEPSLNAATPIERSLYNNEYTLVKDFIESCNEIDGFEGVLEMAAMDYEAFGWCAIEVVRSLDKKVRKIAHVPASRVQPLIGWKGFIETVNDDPDRTEMFYVPFGTKVVHKAIDPILNMEVVEPYDPKKHGDISSPNVQFNLVDRKTGEPTDSFVNAANEIIWIKNNHPNTIYYGYTDVAPAIGAVVANIKIRNYFLQFFSHNAIPRYAVIVEGAKISPEVMKLIHNYFDSEIKKTSHSTLILNVPSMRGEVKVRFEKLDTEQKEGDFLKTSESNRQAIMTAHGVSGAIIGITDTAELGSGKGLSQAEIYKDRVVVPRQHKWERVIEYLFKHGLGVQYVKLKFNPLDIRDREAEMRILTSYADRGAMSINDIRDAIGMPPIEGGNRAFVKSRSGQLVFVDGFDDAGAVAPEDPAASQMEQNEDNISDQSEESETPDSGDDSDNNGDTGNINESDVGELA